MTRQRVPGQLEAASAMTVVIRRRGGLMALIAVLALGLAAAYLWRFSQTQSGLFLALGSVLGVVAVVHGLAYGDARTPLLVADQTGLRVRLGGNWVGLTWTQIERLEVAERGRVRDGHVAVFASEVADVLREATLRSRFGAAFNRFAYDAPLVVPFGLTTTLSVVDVADALKRLSQGRARVEALNAAVADPEPTVEVTAPVHVGDAPMGAAADGGPETPHPDHDVAPDDADADLEDESPGDESSEAVRRPGGATSPWSPAALGVGSFKLPWPIPKRPTSREHPDLDVPAARAVSPLTSGPGRREEITMSTRREPMTDGMLALSDPYADLDTEPLPEIRELHRAKDFTRDADRHDARHDETMHKGSRPDEDGGNIGLVIDATTDLSARAMRKVRRPNTPVATAETPVVPVTEAGAFLVVGSVLTQAREQLGLTVDELAERTRIRPFVIESIEVDDFRPCGGDFYARGHLRMLGRVLGIDAEPLVASYDEDFAEQPITPRAIFDAELSAGTIGMVRGGASGPNWGALIATVLVIMLLWGVAQFFSRGSGPSASEELAPQNSAGLGSPGPGNKPLPDPRSPKTPMTFVKVMARSGDSRVVVRDGSGDVVFQGRLVDGDSTRVVGAAPLRVMAADAGVVALRIKGQQLGLMGEEGQRAFRRIRAPR